MKTCLQFLTVIFILFSGILFGCKHKTNQAEQIPELHVLKITETTVPTFVDMVGQAVAVSTVQIVARIEGTLESQNFKDGEIVRKGDVLYRIQRTQYENQLLAAEAQLESSKASYAQAQSNLERMRPLVKSNAVSQTSYDAAVAQEKEALASVHQANANYKIAQLDYSYTAIESPITGLIGKTNVSVGNLVSPTGDVLTTVTSMNPIYIQFDMNEGKYLELISDSLIRKGLLNKKNRATVTILLPDQTSYPEKGWLDYISPTVNAQTGTITMRATLPNPEYILRPGNFVTVRLVVSESKQGILVPQSIISQIQSKYFVYVVDSQNKISQSEVKTGSIIGNNIQILSGLRPGEVVLTEGFQFVRSGMQIKPVYSN